MINPSPHAALRGRLMFNEPLAPYTWFRVGGPADVLYLPADREDLAVFLAQLSPSVPVTVLGVGSNVIIRDGGVEGVVVRLAGRAFAGVERIGQDRLELGAALLDAKAAEAAAEFGLAGLEFLVGVPGTIGGALKMNAGCYDREMKDVMVSAHGIDRMGCTRDFSIEQACFSYRHSAFPDDVIMTHAVLRGTPGADPENIRTRMSEFRARREAAQPIREKTGGSTFANPDPPDAPDQRKAWRLIDAAGLRGHRLGGAMVSEKHCNFLINTGDATAADIEDLGEHVRSVVRNAFGVDLRWEIKRIGRRAPQSASGAKAIAEIWRP